MTVSRTEAPDSVQMNHSDRQDSGRSTKHIRGILCMLAASCLFASGGLVLKWCDWNPLAINGIRSFFGLLVIGGYILFTRRKVRWNKAVLFGAFSYVAMTTLFILSNRLTAAGNAIVLQFSCPVWIVLLNFLLYKKLPSKKQTAALLLILCGIICFFIDSLKSGNLAGDLFAILSGFFYAVMFMLNSIEGGDAISSVFIGQIVAFLLLAPFSLSCSWTIQNFASIFWLGTFQVGFAYLFFCLGTGLIHPLEASLITAIEPILNPMLVALFGFEQLSGLSLIGAAIVIGAVVWNSLPSGKEKSGERELAKASN